MSLDEFEKKVIALAAEELVSLGAEDEGFPGTIVCAVLREISTKMPKGEMSSKVLAFFLTKLISEIVIQKPNLFAKENQPKMERRVYELAEKSFRTLRKL